MRKVLLSFYAAALAALPIVSLTYPPIEAQALASDPVVIAAGDIASCSGQKDEATARLLDKVPGTVITLGDHAYPDGTLAQMQNCYGSNWGIHKTRTRPAVGNHEYHTAGAAGYFTYFGNAASPLQSGCKSHCKGYYSYNLGAWHIVVLNSSINHAAGSPQEKWLRNDLAQKRKVSCVLAYWHHPRFSSGEHSNTSHVAPLWRALYDYGADVVLNGHDHLYERFAPQNALGKLDSAHGIRQFIVGTGGASLYAYSSIKPNSQVRNNRTWGVLKLTLHPGGYDWKFLPVSGQTFTDSGSARCVGPAGPSSAFARTSMSGEASMMGPEGFSTTRMEEGPLSRPPLELATFKNRRNVRSPREEWDA